MNHEICNVIQQLGLPKSAHELWFCTDKPMPHCRTLAVFSPRTSSGIEAALVNTCAVTASSL